jgi:Na+-driven multidrug efflux pump
MIMELSLESVFALVDIYFVSKLGQNAIATVGLTESVIAIVYSVAISLGTAAATLVGQNLGAKQIERAHESVMLTAKYHAVFMGLVMLLFLFFSDPIIRLFTQDESVITFGVLSLQIFWSGYIFYGIGIKRRRRYKNTSRNKFLLLLAVSNSFRIFSCAGIGNEISRSGCFHTDY